MTFQPTFDIIDAWPSAAVAAGGTILFPYPSGRNYQGYDAATARLAVPGFQTIYTAASGQIEVALTTTGAVVTLVSVPPIPANAKVTLGLEAPLPITAELARISDVVRFSGDPHSLMVPDGDSLLDDDASDDSLLSMVPQRGLPHWIQALTKNRIRIPKGYMRANGGDTTEAILAGADAGCALPAGWALLGGGRNDPGTLTFDQSIANLQEYWQKYLNSGKRVIALPPFPSSFVQQSNRDALWSLIHWVEDRASVYVRNFKIFPMSHIYGDALDANGAPKSGYSYDGTHDKALGSYRMAVDSGLIDYLVAQTGPYRPTFSSVIDVYSAANPRGSLLTNGILDGAAAAPGSGFGGGTMAPGSEVAPGWTYSANTNGGTLTGLTHTLSKITHPVDGRPGQRIRLQGSYTGAGAGNINNSSTILFQQTLGLTNIGAGTYVGKTEIHKHENANERLTGLETQLAAVISGSTHRRGSGSSYGDLLPDEAFEVVHETPPLALTAAPTSLVFGVRAYLANNAETIDSTFDVFAPVLQKV